MFRSSHRHVVRTSTNRPRFAPRLEALESRYAPACTFNPSNGVLYGDAGDTVLLYYVPWSDGQDIYCNFQYIGTNFSDLYFYTEPQSTFLEIDTTLSTSAGDYYVDYYGASFGNTIYFMNWKPADVAFILGNAANTVTVGGGNPNVTVVGWSQSQPAQVYYYEDVGTEYFNITQNEIHPISSAGDVDFYNVNEIIFYGDASDTNITVKNTAGSLGTMPLIYLQDYGGFDVLTVDASAQSVNEKYYFDELRMSMPDYFKNIVWYSGIERITLKAGSGSDQVTLNPTNGGLNGLPLITVNGGNGSDTLTLDAADQTAAESYYFTEGGVHMPNWGKDILYYLGVETTTLLAGSGADQTHIFSNNITLNGVPPITINGGNGTDSIGFYDYNATHSNAYSITNSSMTPAGLSTFGYSAVEALSLFAASGNNSINISNASLATMPFTFIDGGNGTDSITLDGLNSTHEKYYFTELGIAMPNWAKDVLYYQVVENVTLKAGAGNDEITVGNNSNQLLNLPYITGNGGGGTDTMILNDTGWVGGRTYYLSEAGLSVGQPNTEFIFYPLVESVTLKSGTGEDFIRIGSNQNKLAGIPDIDVQAGTGAANYLYFTDSANTAAETYTFTENQLLMPQSLALVATFSNVSQFHLYPGSGSNLINLAPTGGSLLAMAKYFGMHGGTGSNTISVYDPKNPNTTTYIATSSALGTGAVTIPGTSFGLYFDSISVVNLHVKNTSTVNTNGYNPAHYVLNIYPVLPTQQMNPNDGGPQGAPKPPLDRPDDPEPGSEDLSTPAFGSSDFVFADMFDVLAV